MTRTDAPQAAIAVAPDYERQVEIEAEAREAQWRRSFDALFPANADSNLTAHAKRELELAGLFSEDSDYNGMLGEAVMDLVKVFAHQGHSGFSAGSVVDIFRRVASFDILTPLSVNPAEWHEVDANQRPAGRRLWQSVRKPSVFWREGEDTWYDLEQTRVTMEPENTASQPEPEGAPV